MEQPPGIARSAADQTALAAACAAMPAGYRPRTHLLRDGQPRFVNRLIHETSPYLLQHAHNPVDWWPWGPAALAEAARRDVPLFLSAGYATCHWCHVMEEESFDTLEVAAVLNAGFLPVKLDREQRPDIDHFYILATTLQNRHAGWPNSVWALPDGRPFHTGTYFRKAHFIQVCQAVTQGWDGAGRTEFLRFAKDLTDGVRRIGMRTEPASGLGSAPARAMAQLRQMWNPSFGGFSKGTQFPQEGYIVFLLDHWRRTGEPEALAMARGTLAAIAAGGIHDHAGGGFHRYAVDVNWRTPHFEKMLYNQALLLQCYIELHEISGDPAALRAAERCVAYVLRDLTEGDGAFRAAEDADSADATGRLEEGAFYVWPPDQARAALAAAGLAAEADWAIATLGLDRHPTVEAGPVAHLDPAGLPDLGLPDPAPDPVPDPVLDPVLDRVLDALHKARGARARPLCDTKVIAGWNGLMIRALADAGRIAGRSDWIAAARRAALAVFRRLGRPDGLARLAVGDRTAEAANLSDFAWMGLACVALDDAGADGAGADGDWLDRADALARDALDRFGLPDGRLALVRDGPLGPILENEDGAVPSGESSMLELLAMLDARHPDPQRRHRADALAGAMSGRIAEMPVARLAGLVAARMLADGTAQYLRPMAGGAVRLALTRGSGGAMLTVAIAPGWHVAADGGHGMTGLAIAGAAPRLPAPEDWPSPLAGTIPAFVGTLRIPLVPQGPRIAVTVQACSDTLCAAPQTVSFQVPT
jgi:uncharacterized protein YyaL (SSP411 family)